MSKLIIEKITNDIYAYVESASQYAKMSKHRRATKKLPVKVLDDECDLSFLPDHSYIVVNIVDEKPKKKKPAKKKPAKKKKKARGK